MIARYISRLNDTLAMLKKEAQLAGIPFLKMLWQTSRFCLKTGLGPRYFVVAGMARKNFKEDDKWLHISAREYYKAVDILNPRLYRKFTQSKLTEKALYQLLKLPISPLVGYYRPIVGVTNDGRPLTDAKTLADLFQLYIGKTLVVKPLEGFGGNGVIALAISLDREKLKLLSVGEQKEYTIENLIQFYTINNLHAEFLIEEYIKQSVQLAQFNSSSLNTLRLWVLETAPDQAEVLGGYLRIGRAGKVIDNASAGGIIFPINITTGVIEPGLLKNTPHRDDILCHPDHGAKIAGQKIEQWHHVKQFATEVLLELPHTKFAGLDIAMTERGPVLIESNVAPDKDGAAHGNIPSVKLQQVARKHYVKHH
jgi:hypothetical protein